MQEVELKWLILHKINKMIPFITCEIPFCQDVCKLVLGVGVFDLDFGIQINSIEQPFKSNSVSSGDVSHCKTSAFHNHFNYSFVVVINNSTTDLSHDGL